jgi:hypothetical protein
VNFTQIFALVLQAFFTRSAEFAVTVGSKHLGVTIVENATPGNSGSFTNILGIVGTIFAGQPGTFTIGVFSVTISLLVAAPATASAATGPVPSAAAIAAGTHPA